MSKLVASQVCKLLGDPPQSILKNISLEISPGDFVALTGKSGSGKSTLLYILSTLDDPSSGSLSFDGTKVSSMDSETLHRFRNEQVGFVFQFHYLLPELSALENVLMPARRLGLQNQKKARAIELLEMFDLQDKAKNLPRQMSGGQNQRVAIARSLLMGPKFLFADEPTGNLDSGNSKRVFEILRHANQDLGTTVVMVTHDNDLAKMANRLVELKDGEIIVDKRLDRQEPAQETLRDADKQELGNE